VSAPESRPPIGLPLVILAAIAGTAVMVALDAYEWFYHHSRRGEGFDYDEVVAFMSLFMVVGLLVLAIGQRRQAIRELERRREVEEALHRLNQELENRVRQQTAEMNEELEERKRAEERLGQSQRQLRRLSAELYDAEERQRRRIATELHDNVGNSLAIVSNQLSILESSSWPEPCRVTMAEISERVAESIRYSRSLVSKLSSPLSEYLPLDSAVRWLAEDILHENHIAVDLDVDGAVDFPAGDERALFLLALQEILVNVVKHARARSVQITLRAEAESLRAYVADDGVGFDVAAISPPASAGDMGFGLQTVADRMEALGGSVSVQSRPGRGTWVSLSVPLAHTSRGDQHEHRDRIGGRPSALSRGHSLPAEPAGGDDGCRRG
jgi:signal transduction histidine kinase